MTTTDDNTIVLHYHDVVIRQRVRYHNGNMKRDDYFKQKRLTCQIKQIGFKHFSTGTMA